LQDKRASTADALAHPWLSIALTQEQAESWARLQEDQASLDRQLQAASNPRLVRGHAQHTVCSSLLCHVLTLRSFWGGSHHLRC
jgi:hypothetical protein